MLEVARAEYRDGYRVWIEFNSGESGIVDLSDALWGPMFEPLRDIERFKRLFVSDILHTLAWDNDADLSPEFLQGKLAGCPNQPTVSTEAVQTAH